MAINRIPYGTSLRVLGRLLNGDKARMVTVCEIDQGFLLHYFAQGDPRQVRSRAIHNAEVLDLDELLQGQRGKPEPTGSFKGLQSIFGFRQSEALRFQKSHPLCPIGYEHILRALGAGLDRRGAQAVLVTELDAYLHVEYTVDRADFVVRNGQRTALPGRRQERYTGPQLDQLVRKAREQAIERVRTSGQNLSFNPLDVASYLSAAAALEEDGHYDDAEDLYRRAVQLTPDHADAQYHVARHARRRGDRRAALKHVERALALQGENGRFLHLLGRLQLERGHYEEAAAALQRALVHDPANSVYKYDLERVRGRLGDGRDTAHDSAGVPAAAAQNAQSFASPTVAELWPLALSETAPSQTAPSQTAPSQTAPPQAAPSQTAPSQVVPPQAIPTISSVPATPDTVGPTSGTDVVPVVLAHRTSTHATVEPEEPPPPRSLAARLGGSNPGESTPVARPATPARQDWTPFDQTAPAWETAPAEPSSALPLTTSAGLEPAGSSLPVLGLASADNWSTPTLPSVHVPADGAAAAAALPLAVTNLQAPDREGATFSGAPVPAALTERGESVPTESAEAVHLAAAIMRVTDLVRAEPQRPDLHRRLGFLLAKQGRSEEAAAEFRLAAECGRRRLTG